MPFSGFPQTGFPRDSRVKRCPKPPGCRDGADAAVREDPVDIYGPAKFSDTANCCTAAATSENCGNIRKRQSRLLRARLFLGFAEDVIGHDAGNPHAIGRKFSEMVDAPMRFNLLKAR